jgi:hypothetical protein
VLGTLSTNTNYILTDVQQSRLLLHFADDMYTESYIVLLCVRYIATTSINTNYVLTVVQQSQLLLHFTDDTYTDSYGTVQFEVH